MDEIWREVKGYEGLYEVSNCGRVRSLNYNHTGETRLLKPVKDNRGYLRIGLCKDGKRAFKKVHRVVAEAFLPNPSNLPQVNHKDEVKTNNAVANLEWISRLDNVRYGTGIERNKKAQLNHPKMSKRVFQYDLEEKLLREWPSAHEVERQIGWSRGHISACCRGEYKTSYGFVWRYAAE